MKKILSFLLIATMLVAMFVMPSAADDKVNYETEFDFLKKAPTVDGVVKKGEYGTLPVHSYPDDKEQFEDTEHNKFTDTEFDFYAGWDADYLYMAWVVTAENHKGLPEQDFNNDGSFTEADYGYMWQYSCVQFIFTPGAPKAGETSYQVADTYGGNYLEVGLTLTTEGEQVRVCWCKPTAAQALEVNDWDAAIVTEDKTTTYEVRIPWGKSGLNSTGNGAQFGLTYAVAAQDFYTDKCGMIEWQDGVLGGKKADNAAVITLTGNESITESSLVVIPSKSEGTIPAEAEGKTQITIDGLNTGITAEMAYLYTDPSTIGTMNTKWSTCVLLAPVEGEEGVYSVAEVIVGAGEEIVFTTELTEGMLAFAAHSDGTGAGMDRKTAATNLALDSKVKFFGVDFEAADTTYTNAMFWVLDAEGDTSTEESSEVETSVDESSKEESKEASKAESSAAATTESSEAEKTEEGGNALIWIIIAVVAVVAIAVVVFVVLKKKKA